MTPEKKVEYVHSSPHAEKLLVRMARVSNPSNENNEETGPKLLQYLIRHKHWSPFETVNLCLKINTTRDVTAQIIRHRTFSFQEYSQRYAPVPKAVVPSLRRQDRKNRQNSTDDLNPYLQQELQMKIQTHFEAGHALYQELLEAGVAKESARKILPMNSPTTIYMNGSLRSWIHYFKVRCDASTQLEHREIAMEARDIFKVMFPVTAAALNYE